MDENKPTDDEIEIFNAFMRAAWLEIKGGYNGYKIEFRKPYFSDVDRPYVALSKTMSGDSLNIAYFVYKDGCVVADKNLINLADPEAQSKLIDAIKLAIIDVKPPAQKSNISRIPKYGY